MSLADRTSSLARSEAVRNFLTYGLGAGFLSGVSFFLVPVYTRVISPEDYGLLELLNTGIAILATVLPLGLRHAYFIEYYHYAPDDRPRLIGNLALLYLLVGTPLILALFGLIGPINRSLLQSRGSVLLVSAALTTAYLSYYRAMLFTTLRMARKALALVSIQVLLGLSVAVANLHLVYYRRLGIEAIVAVNLAAAGAVCLLAAVSYRARIGAFRVDLTWERAKGYFLVGLPLLPAGAAIWVLNAADRWVLTAYGYQRELGLYSLAYKFGTLYSLVVVEAFTAAYQPRVFAYYRSNLAAAERWNLRVLRTYLLVFLTAVTALFLLGNPIYRVLVGRQYYQAYGFILPIVLGYVMVGATGIALSLPLYRRRTAGVALVNGVGAAFNIAANLLLVRRYGPWAAALMTAASFTLTFVLAMALRARVWSEADREGSREAQTP